MGAVQITVTPATASWSFTDGDGELHEGTGPQNVAAVPAGEIALTWNDLPGYDALPAAAAQTLEKEGTVTFTGIYTRQTGSVEIDVTPEEATWSFIDGDGESHQGAGTLTVDNVPTGTIPLTWDDLVGFVTPAQPAPQTLDANVTVTFLGVYDQPPTVALSTTAPEPANLSPLLVAAEFSELVTGFDLTDVGVINGTAGNLQATDGSHYTFDVSPAGQGVISIEIAATTFQDADRGR